VSFLAEATAAPAPTVTATATPSPSPAPSPTTTAATAVQIWTLVVAALAIVATVVGAVLLRRTGKGTVAAAQRAAQASDRSAQAAEKSAQAAQESVGVNRDTAADVAARGHADALAKRYQDAAGQLGHDKAAVRLAGVYAMARLADDWPKERQACVDVLCAYLRMPWPSSLEQELNVRSAIWHTLERHLLRGGAATSWQDINLDLSGVITHAPVFFRRSHFGGDVNLQGAIFHSIFVIDLGTANSQIDLSKATFEAPTLLDVKLGDQAQLHMANAHVTDTAHWTLIVGDMHKNAKVHIVSAALDAPSYLQINRFPAEQGSIMMDEVRVTRLFQLYTNSRVDTQDWHFPRIIAHHWRVGDGAHVIIPQELINSQDVRWVSPYVSEDAELGFDPPETEWFGEYSNSAPPEIVDILEKHRSPSDYE
jgi:hypothetical protein